MSTFCKILHEDMNFQRKFMCSNEHCIKKPLVTLKKSIVQSKMSTSCEFLPIDDNYQTKAIHSCDEEQYSSTFAVIPPISLSTTFYQTDPTQPKRYEYSRSGNPNRDALEKSLAVLDDAKYGLCFASGLGAITVIMHLLETGDHVLCIDDVYGGTNRYFNKVSARFKVDVSFGSTDDLPTFVKAIRPNTKLIWLESPTNPLLKVVDLKAVCDAVNSIRNDIIIVMDNTFLTSFFQRPLNFGADIVVYSLTKYMNGHSDVVMGAAVTNNKELYENMKYIQNACGVVPSPFDCFLVSRSLKTLGLRMKGHMKNGLKVGKFLEKHPMVEKVLHPGLPSHPGYETAKRHWSGCSGMVSFYLRGGLEESLLFMKSLKYFFCAESLGGYESLVEIPSIMTHSSVPPETRKELKITDNLIRLSVGLENYEDLVLDLQRALDIVSESINKRKLVFTE